MLINHALIADNLTPIFVKNFRRDLVATDVETNGTGRYVIADYAPKEGTVLIIKSIVPYAQKRINVGVATEDFEMMTPVEGNGHFLFRPEVNQGAPLFESNLNIPTAAGATPENSPPDIQSAIDCISDQPYRDMILSLDSTVFHIVVSDGGRFRIMFQLARTNMPGAITIGGATNHRVDFAGVYVGGVEMPKQRYDDMVRLARTGS